MLTISLARGRGLSPVQLQKVLFLLGKKLPQEVGPNFYDFQPYNYGPFDSAVYSDADVLSFGGLVSIAKSGGGYNEYSPTPKGLEYAENLKQAAPPRALAYLDRAVQWAQTLSFSGLVRAIYDKYPEYRKNSVFQG
jgi:hypothetical protein